MWKDENGYVLFMKRKLIGNINVYLNEKQEKVWNELPELYTNSQRIEHLINFYIKHNKGGDDNV